MRRNKLKNNLGPFLIIFCVLLVGGCTENENTDEEIPEKEKISEEELAEEKPAREETDPGINAENKEESEFIDVDIRNFEYLPAELTILLGETVRWTNYDTAIHNVVGSGLESQDLKKGESFSYTFEKTGSFDYICTYHPQMKGRINVSE